MSIPLWRVHVPRLKLRDQIAARLVDTIAQERLRPGDRLPPERALVGQLGVSRTVVREALNLLEARGVLHVEHGRGSVISGDVSRGVRDSLQVFLRVKPTALWDLLEIRKILEVEIAGLAARRAHRPDLQAMRGAIEKMRARIESPEGYVDADVEYHTYLARSTGNEVLLRMIEPIGELLRASREVSATRPGGVFRALRAHERILRCVEHGDPEGARREMRVHLLATEHDIRQALGPPRRTERREAVPRPGRRGASAP